MDLDSPWSDFYDLLLQDEASHSETASTKSTLLHKIVIPKFCVDRKMNGHQCSKLHGVKSSAKPCQLLWTSPRSTRSSKSSWIMCYPQSIITRYHHNRLTITIFIVIIIMSQQRPVKVMIIKLGLGATIQLCPILRHWCLVHLRILTTRSWKIQIAVPK